MASPARELHGSQGLKQLVRKLEVPENLRLPYSLLEKDDSVKVFRRINLCEKKLVIFDLNRTLSADALFHEEYLIRFIESLARRIEDPVQMEKFLRGVNRLGEEGCLYQRGNILLNDGRVITASGKIVAPNGEPAPAPPSPHIKIHTMMDLPVQIRGLAMRRGLTMEEIFQIAALSLRDTGVAPILAGFNDKLGNFLESNRFGKKYAIITDNGEMVARAILRLMRMEKFFRSEIIAEAEKSVNLHMIIVELMDRHKVSETEVLMIGDSWGSDIEPLSILQVDGIHIAPPYTYYPPGGKPSVRASSLNSAIDYLETTSRK